MTVKLIGAFLICAGCGAFGFSMAAACRAEEQAMRQFLRALEFMQGELSYRSPPLAALSRSAATIVSGPVQRVLLAFSGELDRQVAPDVHLCMDAALLQLRLPETLSAAFGELGNTLGCFDLPGQLRGLEHAKENARQVLQELTEKRKNHLRSYQTLGLCAGAALAILFL